MKWSPGRGARRSAGSSSCSSSPQARLMSTNISTLTALRFSGRLRPTRRRWPRRSTVMCSLMAARLRGTRRQAGAGVGGRQRAVRGRRRRRPLASPGERAGRARLRPLLDWLRHSVDGGIGVSPRWHNRSSTDAPGRGMGPSEPGRERATVCPQLRQSSWSPISTAAGWRRRPPSTWSPTGSWPSRTLAPPALVWPSRRPPRGRRLVVDRHLDRSASAAGALVVAYWGRAVALWVVSVGLALSTVDNSY